MAIEYSKNIVQMTKAPSLDGLTDVVTQASLHYIGKEANGVDEFGKEMFYQGAWHTTKNLESPDSENFIALNDLTEQQVIDWVLDGIDTDEIESYINAQIEKQKNPTNVPVQLPWNNI